MSSHRNYDSRDLLRIARRAGLYVRQTKGCHVQVTLPTGKKVTFASHGARRDDRKMSVQIKAFQEAGLL
jgi:predicted RNA binding protein YcfA (HicA-like mRNA interferase family)